MEMRANEDEEVQGEVRRNTEIPDTKRSIGTSLRAMRVLNLGDYIR